MLTIDDFMIWLPKNGVRESTSSSYKSWLRTDFINAILGLYNKGDVKFAIDKIKEEHKNEKDRNRRSALNKLKDFIDKNNSELSTNQTSSLYKPNGDNITDNRNISQSDTDKLLPHPLNLILYGPPGTGKTYNTLFHALEIIKGDSYVAGKTYEDLKPDYDKLVDSGQIVFTTFHQSMSYEDFIEGIKPIPLNDEIIKAIHTNKQSGSTDPQFGDGTTIISGLSRMKYDVKDGIFKQICEKAEKAKIVLSNRLKEIVIVINSKLQKERVSLRFGMRKIQPH